ncbi:hypothetical protein H072_3744 [Dactylellina haptotyla CBS 200.50]|uniref:G domain-containing protein n=1 Tax=Dactylellina haptotyla (strain CBS 200.50) TaxID=1284197 RepID=S8C3J7_DACHA|nr:hypothetical protein H072_3744 [Dactylellina haptotyla CBS 200.50]
MTKNVAATHYSFDDEDFDLIDDATEVELPPPTPPTQSAATANDEAAAKTPVGKLPLSPTSSAEDAAGSQFDEETPKAGSLLAPPLPPKPSTYASQIDAMAQKMSDSNLEDSFISTGNVSESGESGYNLYSGSKRVYKALKNHMDWGREKEVLIAVMGMTGAGKTTFISKATGKSDLLIGHSLESCTREISVHETKIDDTTVRFVDTPGFSDTYLSDTEVLEMIADYLAAAYTKDVKLNGIIYLHPISENRMTNPATKNLEMFRKLTGEKNLKNVVLATSMWDKVTVEEGARREKELKNKFWRLLLDFQAQTIKYRGTPDSAKEIASLLMENKPFYLQLQEEMGKGNKALKDTSAGKEIMQEIIRIKEQHERELAEMKDMIVRTQEEKNDAAVKTLEEHYRGLLRDMERTMMDERRMNDEAVKSLNERISALESRGMCHIM